MQGQRSGRRRSRQPHGRATFASLSLHLCTILDMPISPPRTLHACHLSRRRRLCQTARHHFILKRTTTIFPRFPTTHKAFSTPLRPASLELPLPTSPALPDCAANHSTTQMAIAPAKTLAPTSSCSSPHRHLPPFLTASHGPRPRLLRLNPHLSLRQ